MRLSDTKAALCHDDADLQALFDRMGPTYGLMNVLSSFGFSELWRRACVRMPRSGRATASVT